MSARETILSRIAGAGRPPAPRASYGPPALADPAASFRAKARASHAEVHEIGGAAEVPEAALAILSGAGAALRLHLPGNSPLRALPWHRAPELVLDDAPPGGEDAALSAADYAIAETGTLAFLSGAARPSSWHFLPGRELVLLSRGAILANLEELFARLGGTMPATLNLVTGPSRTADIEQTMERGAHGPRALHILIASAV